MSVLLYILYLELESILGNLVLITYEYALSVPSCSCPHSYSKHLNSLILSNPETAFSSAQIEGESL